MRAAWSSALLALLAAAPAREARACTTIVCGAVRRACLSLSRAGAAARGAGRPYGAGRPLPRHAPSSLGFAC